MDFTALGLDARVARAAAKRFALPTAVQAQAIPKALAGKDVVAQAATGSGKTLAYLLPCLHRLLTSPPQSVSPGPRALVLVPTRELCQQVRDEAAALATACGGTLRVGQLPGAGAPAAALAAAAASPPDVLVATPARVATALRDGLFRHGSVSRGLQFLVLDEADLLLSFGHEEDVTFIASKLARGVQAMLVSATCSGAGIERLQKLLLTDPAIITVAAAAGGQLGGGGGGADNGDEEDPDADGDPDAPSRRRVAAPNSVTHTVLRCPPKDKLLYVLALLRLGRVKRKALIFAPNANAAVRLRLFLERFGVRCATAHAELPAASRQLALAQFNRGLFDFLIVADDDAKQRAAKEKLLQQQADNAEFDDAGGDAEDGAADGRDRRAAGDAVSGGGKAAKGRQRDAEYGLVRGIDFKDVVTVINVDVPPDAATYVHRVGRCARGPGGTGTALTLCSTNADEEQRLAAIAAALSPSPDTGDENARAQPAFAFQQSDVLHAEAVDALRYRAEDVLRGLGASAVREARLRELRNSLLGSERLAAHFDAHPHDRRLLQADAPLTKTPVAAHLKHLPVYLRTGGPIRAPPERAAKKREREEAEGKQRRQVLRRMDTSEAAAQAQVGGDGDAPAAQAAAPAMANVSKLLWAKEDGPKKTRRKKPASLGPEYPLQRRGGGAHARIKRNVRRGRRKTDR